MYNNEKAKTNNSGTPLKVFSKRVLFQILNKLLDPDSSSDDMTSLVKDFLPPAVSQPNPDQRADKQTLNQFLFKLLNLDGRENEQTKAVIPISETSLMPSPDRDQSGPASLHGQNPNTMFTHRQPTCLPIPIEEKAFSFGTLLKTRRPIIFTDKLVRSKQNTVCLINVFSRLYDLLVTKKINEDEAFEIGINFLKELNKEIDIKNEFQAYNELLQSAERDAAENVPSADLAFKF